ncbi:MAG TPA: MlaA family lipoprotein [Stellaceae bacterium]|nr:MlaA family lipoprotein [Stellaceae bacterium]
MSALLVRRWAGPLARGGVFCLIAALAACATPPADPDDRAAFEKRNDPLEPLNRKVLDANQFLDRIVMRPAAKAYVFAVPEDARAAIRHVLDNMKEPNLVFNNALQGEFKRAGISMGRFVINSTAGVGGIIDIATKAGLDRQPADFGQTLFVWGLPSGPYIVIPILGPSTPRDAIGMAVDSYADPFTILAMAHGVTELTTSRFLVNGVDQRASLLDLLDDLEKNSLDFYAQLRSLAQQRREAELHHDAPAAAGPSPGAGQDTTPSPDATPNPAPSPGPEPGPAQDNAPAAPAAAAEPPPPPIEYDTGAAPPASQPPSPGQPKP